MLKLRRERLLYGGRRESSFDLSYSAALDVGNHSSNTSNATRESNEETGSPARSIVPSPQAFWTRAKGGMRAGKRTQDL